jgi:two-component system, LuxR family, response regulator FixJ
MTLTSPPPQQLSPSTGPTRPASGQVYVVDDDPEVGRAISWALDSVGYSVAVYPVAEEFLSQATTSDPSVVIIDMVLPGMTGLNLCREIVWRAIPCAFVMISGHADVPSTVEALHLGATDLLEKPFSHQRLVDAVHRTLHVARVRHKNRLEEREISQRVAELSPREREVFQAVAEGLVTKEIAKRLGVSPRTVDVHRSRIMQKLGLDSPLQLANVLVVMERKTGSAPAEMVRPSQRDGGVGERRFSPRVDPPHVLRNRAIGSCEPQDVSKTMR